MEPLSSEEPQNTLTERTETREMKRKRCNVNQSADIEPPESKRDVPALPKPVNKQRHRESEQRRRNKLQKTFEVLRSMVLPRDDKSDKHTLLNCVVVTLTELKDAVNDITRKNEELEYSCSLLLQKNDQLLAENEQLSYKLTQLQTQLQLNPTHLIPSAVNAQDSHRPIQTPVLTHSNTMLNSITARNYTRLPERNFYQDHTYHPHFHSTPYSMGSRIASSPSSSPSCPSMQTKDLQEKAPISAILPSDNSNRVERRTIDNFQGDRSMQRLQMSQIQNQNQDVYSLKLCNDPTYLNEIKSQTYLPDLP